MEGAGASRGPKERNREVDVPQQLPGSDPRLQGDFVVIVDKVLGDAQPICEARK